MAAPDRVVNLRSTFDLFEDQWSPKIVAAFNDNHVKVARIEGTFEWHTHDDTDEVFLVIDGTLDIEVEGRDRVTLSTGDLYVVPAGLQHRPVAAQETLIALIEPAGVPNTGDAGTAAVEEWI